MVHYKVDMNSFLTDLNTVVTPDFGCIDHDRDVISYSLSQSPDDSTFDVSSGKLTVSGMNCDYFNQFPFLHQSSVECHVHSDTNQLSYHTN
jgi:hypothetical protein